MYLKHLLMAQKEGFQVVIKIIPYLVAMLIAIAVFRATGCMDYIVMGLGELFAAMGMNTDFVPTYLLA